MESSLFQVQRYIQTNKGLLQETATATSTTTSFTNQSSSPTLYLPTQESVVYTYNCFLMEGGAGGGEIKDSRRMIMMDPPASLCRTKLLEMIQENKRKREGQSSSTSMATSSLSGGVSSFNIIYMPPHVSYHHNIFT